ncbi:hypothetical protein NM688_g2077 [Phlebia brevispora]|uniref:Uncharacterized protein n=1 Tax=Phlebia brevispora TaxID=194682 RepID=A0ACC1T9M3_9APHY|nr:hypothetical protein NM688_g2077 [Phlebia brevispora]
MSSHQPGSKPLPSATETNPSQASRSPTRNPRPLPSTPSRRGNVLEDQLVGTDQYHQASGSASGGKRASLEGGEQREASGSVSLRSMEKRPVTSPEYQQPSPTHLSISHPSGLSYASGSDISHTSQWGYDEPFDPYASYSDRSYHARTVSISTNPHPSSPQEPLISREQTQHSPEPPAYPPAGSLRAIADAYLPEKATIVLTAEMDVPLNSPDTDDPRGPTGHALSMNRIVNLAEVDNAYFSFFHFKVCLIAGIGFFVDAYDIFSINVASTMLAYVYTGGKCLQFPGGQGSAIKAAAPVGNFVGQLLFGWMADRIGRKRIYGIELMLIIIGAFGQALASNNSLDTVNIVSALVIWRFIMGSGIGGDYPLSAVITSEFAATHIRGRMMTAVFANQGWGQLVASAVGCFTVLGFRHIHGGLGANDTKVFMDIDRSWRILVGLGCLPAAIGLYSRLTIPESPRFTMDIERNVRQAVEDIDQFIKTGQYKFNPDSVVVRVIAPRASWRDFRSYFSEWENRKLLIGCAVSWFAIDVTFYGIGLNTDTFFNAIGFVADNGNSIKCPANFANEALVAPFDSAYGVYTYFINLCTANMVLSLGSIPGYWATFLLIDNEKVGRKRIQLQGFTVLTILFLTMGIVFPKLVSNPTFADSLFSLSSGAKGFIALLCIASFFQNFGPNTTTFVIPGELFPTRYRSTCHGISAASGKVGAIISQFVLTRLHRPGDILGMYSAFTALGFLSTLLLFETNRRTIEANSQEDQRTFITGLVRPAPLPRAPL